MYNSELITQDLDSVLEFMEHDLHIARVNAFRFVSQLPITGIDRALVRGNWHNVLTLCVTLVCL